MWPGLNPLISGGGAEKGLLGGCHSARGTPAQFWRADARWERIPSMRIDDDKFSRLVVLAAHPDDESLGERVG